MTTLQAQSKREAIRIVRINGLPSGNKALRHRDFARIAMKLKLPAVSVYQRSH